MTTITIERELLEQALAALSAPNYRVFSESSVASKLRAALAAPATAPEKTVQEIMEFARHYAADTFSSATLEDKIRRSLAAPATAPAWHVAPTVPGLWMCNYGDLSVATVNQPDIDTFDPAYNTGGRWYGPIPEDKS